LRSRKTSADPIVSPAVAPKNLDSQNNLGRIKSPKQGVKAMQSSPVVSANEIEIVREQGEGPQVIL
jgi:hypothetical protein